MGFVERLRQSYNQSGERAFWSDLLQGYQEEPRHQKKYSCLDQQTAI